MLWYQIGVGSDTRRTMLWYQIDAGQWYQMYHSMVPDLYWVVVPCYVTRLVLGGGTMLWYHIGAEQ